MTKVLKYKHNLLSVTHVHTKRGKRTSVSCVRCQHSAPSLPSRLSTNCSSAKSGICCETAECHRQHPHIITVCVNKLLRWKIRISFS